MTASASTVKAAELLKCSDSDFDMGIKEMGLKELLDTISSLQKEMSREQENFNSLSSELGALNKNSRQYKQIQKEMTASQNKLTALMNKSMKCFQQQGNQHVNKPGNPVQRRNSGRERSGSADSNVQRRHSARVSGEEVVLIKSSFENPTVKSNPDLLNDVPSKPVILKPLNDLENSKLFVKKQNTVHSSTVAVKPQQITQQEKNVEIINGSKRNSSVGNFVNSSTVNVQSRNSSSAAQNGFRSSVTFNQGGSKPSSSQVNDKPVVMQVANKSVVNQNGDTKTVNGVGEKPPRENLIARETESRKEQGQVYSSGITLKPTNSVINGETKKVNSASNEQPAAKSKSSMPPVVLQGSRPLITDSNVGSNRDKLFDEIKNFKRKSDTIPDVKRPQEKEIFSSFKTGSVVEKSKEKSVESGAQKDVDKKEHEEVDSGTEDTSGETSPEQEKFVSKYSFPQKPKRDPVKMEEKKLRAAPAPPVQGTVTQGQITTLRQNPVSTSLKAIGEQTRARLQRLQELQEQRLQRQNSAPARTRSTSLDRDTSVSSERLFVSRGNLDRASSFRSSGRRTRGQPSVDSIVSSIRESHSRRSDSSAVSNTDSTKTSTDDSNTAAVSESSQNPISGSDISELSTLPETESLKTEIKDDTHQANGTSLKSSEGYSVSAETDKKLQEIASETQAARMGKMRELEEMRLRSRGIEDQSGAGLTAREKFNRNHSSAQLRSARQLSVRDQIRNSRQARRHSDLQLSSTGMFDAEDHGTSSSVQPAPQETTARAERPKILDTTVWDKTLSEEKNERIKRLNQIKMLKRDNRSGNLNLDTCTNLLTSSETDRPTYDTSSNRIFPLSRANRSDSMPSLVSTRRVLEPATSFSSILEQREPSSYMPSSGLSSYSRNLPSRQRTEELSVDTELTSDVTVTDLESTEPRVSVYSTSTAGLHVEEVEPSDIGYTRRVVPTSLVFNEIRREFSDFTQALTRQASAPILTDTELERELSKKRKKHNGLPEELQDHYLAECFDPKYTLKERIVLIRKKLWGDPPNVKVSERGNPDGASCTESSKTDNESGSVSESAAVKNNSENTKTI